MATWLGQQGTYKDKNIEPSGDPLQPRAEDDGIFRLGYQNIHGTTLGQGLEIAEEIDVMRELGVDVQGMSKINKPWSPNNKWQYNMMMDMVFDSSFSVFSSAESTHDCNYQPGGNLLTINGHNTGRKEDSGSDKWGRFCWFTLRGQREEGIIVINLYRVCHEKGDNPGPYTAYTQQYTAMRAEGQPDPNPRRQVLQDVMKLIQQKRGEGYRPIVMMDANGDYNNLRNPDRDLAAFVRDSHLVDHYHKKYPEQIRTYMYGSKRLDYILVDPGLVPAIKNIGYLGTHEGSFSDHVYAYVDFDEKQLFKGIINRPVPTHAREFRIEQTDKKVKFVAEAKPQFEAKKIRSRVFALAEQLHKFGATKKNVRQYQVVDRDIRHIAVSAAKKTSKKKFGYMRSPQIQESGRMLVVNKMILDCKQRNAPPTQALLTRAETLGVDLQASFQKSYTQQRREVAERHRELKIAQKTCESDRADWLQKEAKARAQAAGDLDWEKNLKRMTEVAESRATNRKLSAITKGCHRQLDSVKTSSHDWFYSAKANELYHYVSGTFEAHPSMNNQHPQFFSHHTLKVIPPDARLAIVTTNDDGSYTLDIAFEWYLSATGRLFHMTKADGTHNYVLTPGEHTVLAHSVTQSLLTQRQSQLCTQAYPER